MSKISEYQHDTWEYGFDDNYHLGITFKPDGEILLHTVDIPIGFMMIHNIIMPCTSGRGK